MHYLYRITNLLDNKVYIGQSVDDKYRWRQHIYYAKNPEKTKQYIHRAMNKYGTVNFIFEIIATCRTQEDADMIEIQLISQYDSRNPEKGYNLCQGGGGGWFGKHHTEESKEKNRKSHLGIKQSEETKQKHSKTMKEKISNGWVPKTIFQAGSDAARTWKGKKFSEEHKKRISESGKGRIVSEETKKKLRDAHPKKMLTNDQLSIIQDLLSKAHSLTEIEKITGIERHFISRELKRLGIR